MKWVFFPSERNHSSDLHFRKPCPFLTLLDGRALALRPPGSQTLEPPHEPTRGPHSEGHRAQTVALLGTAEETIRRNQCRWDRCHLRFPTSQTEPMQLVSEELQARQPHRLETAHPPHWTL